MEEKRLGSMEILKRLHERLLKKGNLVKNFGKYSATIDSHDDYHRTDYTRLHGSASLLQMSENRVLGVASGDDFYGLNGVIACSSPFDESLINRLNRFVGVKKLPKTAQICDLTEESMNLIFFYLGWSGVLKYYNKGLKKVSGINETLWKEYYVPSRFEAEEPEKDYIFGKKAGIYVVRNHPGIYKNPGTLDHLESWLEEKLQIK